MLGVLETPQVRLLNRLEAPWFSSRRMGVYCIYDQAAMAVAMHGGDGGVVTRHNRYFVRAPRRDSLNLRA